MKTEYATGGGSVRAERRQESCLERGWVNVLGQEA